MKRRIIVNNHLHTNFSQDCKGYGLTELVISLKSKGIKYANVTDHFPLIGTWEFANETNNLPLCNGNIQELRSYIKKFKKVQENQNDSQFYIGLGREIDFSIDHQKDISKLLRNDKHNYNLSLGSVHYIPFLDGYEALDHTPELFERIICKKGNINNVLVEYFNQVNSLINSGLFDVVAHMDLVKKFNKEDCYFSEESKLYKDLVMECLYSAKKSDIVIGINTSGLLKPVNKTYPSPWVLKEAKKLGLEVTIGTDAHSLENLTTGYKETHKLLENLGYKKIVAFVDNKKEYVKI